MKNSKAGPSKKGATGVEADRPEAHELLRSYAELKALRAQVRQAELRVRSRGTKARNDRRSLVRSLG